MRRLLPSLLLLLFLAGYAMADGIISSNATWRNVPYAYIYPSLNAAITAAGSTPTKLIISTPLIVTASVTTPATLALEVTEGGSIAQTTSLPGPYTLTISGPFSAPGQAFSGFSAGQVTGLNEANPVWFGASNNATGTLSDVDAGAAVNAAIASLTSGGTLKMTGSFRIDTNILPKSNTNYDLSKATIYAGTLRTPQYVLYVNGQSNINIYPGQFLPATYSAMQAETTGSYVHGEPIGIRNGSTNVYVHPGGYVSGYGGVADIYDSSYVTVEGFYGYNNNAGIQGVTTTQNMYGINFINNHLIGCGDDALSLLLNGTGTYIYFPQIQGNYVDKTRFTSPHVGAAVGLRVGVYGTSGKVIGAYLAGNRFNNMSDQAMFLADIDSSVIEANTVDGFGAGGGAQAFMVGTSDAHQITNTLISNNSAFNSLAGNNKAIECAGLVNSTIRGGTLNMGANGASGFGIIHIYNSSTGNVVESVRLTSTTATNYGVASSGAAINNTVRNNVIALVSGVAPISLVAESLAYGNSISSGPSMGLATPVSTR